MIKKGKHNLEMKPQLGVIHPNSKEAVGNFCPVKILNTYLLCRRSIPDTLNSDPLFPKTQKVCLGFDLTEKVVLSNPVVPHSYDSFRQDLKKICETDAVIASGVDSHYTPHSFRAGGLSVMANGSVALAFIQKAGRHKKIESTNIYMNPNTCTALRTSDLLCGNKDGWKEQLVGRPDSLDPFLYPSQVRESDSSSSSVRPSVQPPCPAQPLGPVRQVRRTATAAPANPPHRSQSAAGPPPPQDSANTETLDGDNTENNGIIWLNELVLKGSISRV